MNDQQSKKSLFFIPLILVVLGGFAIAAFFVVRSNKGEEIKVSPTSPKEVGDAYRSELQTLLTDISSRATCAEQVEQTTKTLESMRVPKENRDAHLRIFLSFTNDPITSDQSCLPQIQTRLQPLLVSP